MQLANRWRRCVCVCVCVCACARAWFVCGFCVCGLFVGWLPAGILQCTRPVASFVNEPRMQKKPPQQHRRGHRKAAAHGLTTHRLGVVLDLKSSLAR